MRQYEGLRNKSKVLGTMLFPHSCEMPVQAILSCYLCGFGPVIDLLKLSKCLIYRWLDVWASPHERPLLLPIVDFSKTIVFTSVTNEPHVNTIIELKVKFVVCWLERSNVHWIYIRSEEHASFLEFTLNCLRLIETVFVGLIELARRWLINIFCSRLQRLYNLLINFSFFLIILLSFFCTAIS